MKTSTEPTAGVSTQQLLRDLDQLGVKFWLDGERLRYRAPRGAITPTLRNQMVAHKAAIMAYLRGLQSAATDREPILPRAERSPGTKWPLSFAQQRLWFLDQLEPNSAFYNMPILLRLTGQLDVAALEASFRYLIERHESLRTLFGTETSTQTNAGQAMQIIHPKATAAQFTLTVKPVVDDDEAQHLAQLETSTSFNLSEGPLLRAQLFQIEEVEHLLIVNMHHIISDGWSTGILVQELAHAYGAYTRGQQPTLPNLPIQYADFALWQRNYLSGERLEAQLAYWRAQLTGAPALLELPTDRPRPPVMSYQGALYAFELSADLTAKLNKLAQKHDATLFMVLLAAFNVLLARYSGQDDIVVGSPIANRNRAEIEGLIGFFVNTLVLRTQLDLLGNPSFTDVLTQVRQTTLDAYQHQDLPFEQLVDALDLERTLSYSPLFQVMLVLQNAEMDEFALSDPSSLGTSLTVTMQPPDFHFAKFDLTFYLIEQGKDAGLLAMIEYATDLFDEATIARMASHFKVLLESIVDQPEQPVYQLPMLTEVEVHQILHEWNDTAVDFGEPQTIHALFEQQVERTPDAIALLMADEKERIREKISSSLTYAELNSRANQLAHHLIELGVQADTLVAVMMERSIEMVVSLLAVLKAGGAVVPIDPTYPEERIRYMLADSATPIVLTQSHLSSAQFIEDREDRYKQNSLGQARRMLAVDMIATELATQPIHNPQTQTDANNLAYIIYTSGSTGQPKGVMIEHQNLFNLLHWTQDVLQLTPTDSVLARTSFSFDVAMRELLSPLISGAAITLVTTEQQHDLHQLLKLMQRVDVSVAHFTPTIWAALIRVASTRRELPNLRILMSGGEALELSLATQIRQIFDGTLFNGYGPTETTISVGLQAITSDMPVISIASPAPNNTFYILTKTLEPVPLGVAGELYIGGSQLARGYLNRPNLTSERFIEHPEFGRLYKTGDLCRWLPDGNACADAGSIEYIGRTDLQVKIRGFRIELGEIENALLAIDGVGEAVVLAREENEGDKRLVAYIVGDKVTRRDLVTPSQLRQALAQQLPDYMIPSAFVFLDVMPLTPNGKLDRRALPAPDYLDTQSKFLTPRTETEMALAQAFAHVLRVEQVGVHDNFFRMGGDSILSIQVVSRAAQQGITVSVKDIFQYPTIAELAAKIDRANNVGQVMASQETQQGDAPLLPIQRWFLDANQPEMHHFNQSFLLTVKQPIHEASLETAIRILLHHHDALRFRYGLHEQDGELAWQQAYLAEYMGDGKHLPLTLVDLRGFTPEEQATEIEQIGAETQISLNPLTGDLVRFVYFQMDDVGQATDRLLIVIHHLAVDGVSWRILIEDLTTLLDGGALALKTSSYRDWGEALQTATAEGYFDKDIKRWLADGQVDHIASLTLDDPDAINTVGSSHHLSAVLSETETEQLLRVLPEKHDVTLDAVVLTALTETLTDGSHYASLRVKFESYGRQEIFDDSTGHRSININRTVGWFTSAYPLTIPRFDGSAVKRIRYTLNQLRRMTESCGAGSGGISFGALQNFHPDEKVRKQFAALPEAEVVYNYLGQLDSLDNHRFGMAPDMDSEAAGASVSPSMIRKTLLDSNAMIVKGQLHIHWTVTPQINLERSQILLDNFQQQLQRLITEACASSEYVPLPSDKEQSQDTESWFVALQPNGSRPPLFCFYPVTGTISQFSNLIPYLSRQQPLYALQARGIYDELPLFKTIEELAADTIFAIKKIQPTGPYHLLGWSYGARLSYEIAQQLQMWGDEIGLLAILDEYPDNPEESRLDMSKENQLANFVYNLGLNHEVDIQYLLQLCQRVITQYGDAPIQPLCRQLADDGYAFPFDTIMVERIYNVYLNNMQMIQQYQLKPLRGDLVVFTAEESDSVSGMTRWANLVSGSVEQVSVQGTHLTLLDPENIENLGDQIEKFLVAGKP